MTLSNTTTLAVATTGLGLAMVSYALPKLMTYLCTSPDYVSGSMGHLRNHMFRLKENVRSEVGERMWFVGTDVIAENGWISVLALSYLSYLSHLTRHPFSSFERGANTCSAFVAFCAVSYLVRRAVARLYHSWRQSFGSS